MSPAIFRVSGTPHVAVIQEFSPKAEAIDAQPCGQSDAPIHDFYLANVRAARRLP